MAKQCELPRLFEIRRIVFVIGQNCPAKDEFDGLDDNAIHFTALVDDDIVGTARLREVDGKNKLERFAVLKEFQGKYIGAKLIQTMLKYCTENNNLPFLLNAQEYVIPFYEKFGFHVVGERFYDVGIPHFRMEKSR